MSGGKDWYFPLFILCTNIPLDGFFGNSVSNAEKTFRVARGLGYKEISMLKSMSVKKDFQTWHLIGWQHSHIRKSLLTNMEYNMDFT